MRFKEILNELKGKSKGKNVEAEQPDSVFIPPLQLKIELLKRAVNVDNVYDHTAELNKQAKEQEKPAPIKEDEIVALKRAAGIKVNPAVIQELSNNDP